MIPTSEDYVQGSKDGWRLPLDTRAKSAYYFRASHYRSLSGADYLKSTHFNCLLEGSRIDADGKSSPDIRRRIAIAISKLNTMAPLWKSQSTELKWGTLKACIFPVAIYGCEASAISKIDEKKITSFEMKCYRKILRISWSESKTNASVLEQLGVKAPQLLNLIKKQKLSYFGHI